MKNGDKKSLSVGARVLAAVLALLMLGTAVVGVVQILLNK